MSVPVNVLIETNANIHDSIVGRYEKIHDEIYNPVEQRRLAASIRRACDLVVGGKNPLQALDLGSGTGNVVRHLVELGLVVTASDIAPKCLAHVAARFPGIDTRLLNGRDLDIFADGSFDIVTSYSVLHHIPDYLAILAECARVLRPGGVMLIDHESNEEYWAQSASYCEFRRRAMRFDWRKYLQPENYYHALRRLLNPRHANEGDIHVWPDDHIDWAKIRSCFAAREMKVVAEDDYLGFRGLYRRKDWERYRDRCTDTKLLIARKTG